MYDHPDARPASELLPWLFLCDDDRTVVNKDSSLLAVFEFGGVDAESGDEHLLENAALQFDAALRLAAANGARVWTRSDRIRSPDYPAGVFDNAMASEIDQLWESSFRGQTWENLYTLAIAMPTQRAQRTVAEIARDHLDDGDPAWRAVPRAVWQKLRGSPSDRIGFETKVELENARLRFEQNILTPIQQQLHLFRIRRLGGEELLGYLRFVSSSGDPAPLAVNEFSYLDAACSDTWIDNSLRDYLVLEGPRREFVAVLTLKDAPPSNRLAALDALMALPVRLTIANCWKASTGAQAITDLKDARTFDEMRQLDLKTLMRGVISSSGDLVAVEDVPKTEVGAAAKLFVDGIKNGTDAWGYLATSIIVRGDSLGALERHIERVQQILEHGRLNFLREREGAISGFAVGLPGNVVEPVRWFHTEASNLTDLAPTISLSSGDWFHPHFSRLAGYEVPAHLTARTRYGTPCHINYHVGEVGHTVYVGPTSAGKTVQKMLMTSQGFKYPHYRAIIFDKDLSCQATTLMHDGEWINMAPASGTNLSETDAPRMNPLAYLREPGTLLWLVNWIDRLMAHRGERLTEQEMTLLNQALERLRDDPGQQPRLSSLLVQLSERESRNLAERLQIWCEGGAYGAYFDNEVDELNFSSITCFEIGGLITLNLGDVLRAFTDYVFFRVERMIGDAKGEAHGPTEIYFEEAGFLLEDPIFAERAATYLMTLRKKNAYLVMTAQSPEPFMRDERLRAAVRDNVATVIFLPNASATRGDLPEMYRRAFGLNTNHLELIRGAMPRREYCIWQPQLNAFRVAVVEMPKPVVARLMSNKASQSILADTWDPNDAGWKERYVQRVLKEVIQ